MCDLSSHVSIVSINYSMCDPICDITNYDLLSFDVGKVKYKFCIFQF